MTMCKPEEYAYLRTDLSPYLLISDAKVLIKQLKDNFSKPIEREVLILINAADLHPKMSNHQLSIVHKAMGDCYYSHGYFLNALAQYNRAISKNPNISVKKRIQEIKNMPAPYKEKYSLPPSTKGDVLKIPRYKDLLERKQAKLQAELDRVWGNNTEMREMVENIRKESELPERLKEKLFWESYEREMKYKTIEPLKPRKSKDIKSNLSLKLNKDVPVPEVPAEIWDDINSLYLFCLGVFNEPETKALETLISNPYSDDVLSKEDFLLLEMHSMLKSHFGKGEANTPLVLEYTGAEIELSAPEILLMQWINGNEVNGAFNPPQYFTCNYDLNVNEALSRLYAAGYITYSDIEYGVKKLKVDDLKAILKKYGIKISGKKADLVEAVIKNVPAEALSDLDKKYFIATNKGSKCIEENKYLKIFQWSHTIGVSPNEAFEYKKLHPDASAYDIGNAFLDKRINAGIEKSVEDTVLLRMAIYGKADLCRLTEHYYEAAKHFIAVAYLDFLEDIRRRVNSSPLLGVEAPSDMKYLITNKLKMPFNEFDKLFIETIVELVAFLDKYHFKFYGHDIEDFQQELVKQIYN